jgi:APA family basic amino acid/polyamine antiporter
VIAAVLALALGVLFLPGMPAALIWPYEWLILGAWAALGLVFAMRIPSVGPGPDAEERVLAAQSR